MRARCRQHLQVHGRSGRRRAHRRIDEIVQDLRGCSDHYNFVFEKCPIGVVRVPEFRIENLIKRPREIGIVRAEPEKMIALVMDNVCLPTELD